jgi:hypothetical protein
MSKSDDGWVLNKKGRSKIGKIGPNELAVAIKTSKTKRKIIILAFGEELTSTLCWEAGDTVCFYYNKDNQLKNMLCRCDNPEGYRLTKLKTSTSLRVIVTWTGDLILQDVKTQIVSFKYHKSAGILFTLPQ